MTTPTKGSFSGGENFYSNGNLIRTIKALSIGESHLFNNTEAALNRGQRFSRTAVHGAVYSVSTSDYLIAIDDLVLAPTIGLPRPSLVGTGKTFIVKDEVGGAATTTITVVSAGEETIDGASSDTITTNYGSVGYYTNGANWFTR